ncbi:hypothetical protein FD46_GL000469 [Liquorilactobacillus oeni DSM 19972]|uniref:Uncharacterized protein n=1 Tax=Liquorilactobacillus oeni DSM 19972 TaxID=1423777 RepID=A0A0R1MCH7_9LACO|nr:hypothetical protein FD46_GL000469 [Liquorilactobacillus oeni DSM 19972]
MSDIFPELSKSWNWKNKIKMLIKNKPQAGISLHKMRTDLSEVYFKTKITIKL